ncbi:MAG: NUDIX domain-containing protein [Phycisphaerae bacterium]|nr:NUDIX domain-containing protein [Phycisphaerae bacterium]
MSHYDTTLGSSQQTEPRSFLPRRGVIGVLRAPETDHVLMIRRAEGIPRGGRWCFPGGHVERNETPRQAVVREFLEELGLVVEPRRRLGAVRLPEAGYILVVWEIARAGGILRPAPAEVADTQWVAVRGIEAVAPGLPSNRIVAEMLRA